MAVKTKISWRSLLPVLLVLFFLSIVSGRTERVAWYEQWVGNILYPFQWLVTETSQGVRGVWHHYFWLVSVEKENEQLSLALKSSQGERIQLQEVAQENERLHLLLALPNPLQDKTVVAKVIAYDPAIEFKSILINKGSGEGLKSGQPVVAASGLVGRVGPVSMHQAQVLLMVDPNSVVDVILERSRVRALLVGTSKSVRMKHAMFLNRLEYLRQQSDIQVGDVVMTSGGDKIFPKGIPVGTVEVIESSREGIFQKAELVPYVNYEELEEVTVILK